MIAISKRDVLTRDIPDMTHDELESQWNEAKINFENALAQKEEADRIYLAAANKLNTLERIIKKLEQRAAVAERAAEKARVRGL